MTTLHEVKGINKYCGPAVLATLTGRTTDECAAAISKITGKNEIRGVEVHYLVETLISLRFDVERPKFYASTLYGVLHELITKGDADYILVIPHHYIAIQVRGSQIFICDNHSKSPLLASSSARLSQRVQQLLKVKGRTIPKMVSKTTEVEYAGGNQIYLTTKMIYEDERDNIIIRHGYLKFTDTEQLRDIYHAIGFHVEKMLNGRL